MELDVGERIVLLSILPSEGDITTIRLVHELKQALSFTEEEHKELNFRTEDDQVFWDKETTREIPMGPKVQVLIAGELEKLSEEGGLKEDHLPLYDKFVEPTVLKEVG